MIGLDSLLALILIVVFFILGFWLGVNTYKETLRRRL